MIDQQIYITPFYRRWLGYPDFYQAWRAKGSPIVEIKWFQSYLDLGGALRLRHVERSPKGSWRPVDAGSANA